MSELSIPDLSLVILVGASGSGKSTFARKHFGPFETLSSDTFRALVSNDEEDQNATAPAFEALNFVAKKRLEAGLLTVVDATSVQKDARKSLIDLARSHDVLPVAIVFDLPAAVGIERNTSRPNRQVPERVVRRQTNQLRQGLHGLKREGFRTVHVLHSVEEVANATIVRTPLLTDHKNVHGPFDVIGDVHGCFDELRELLEKLDYELVFDQEGRAIDARHLGGRRAIFVGDLVDRGPHVAAVLRLAMGMVKNGNAFAVPGNHDEKLQRALAGRKVSLSHGLEGTLAELSNEDEEFRQDIAEFIFGLVSHLVFDDGNLVVAHAGLPEAYHNRASKRVRSFALYGQTTGETDEYGLPVRLPWAADYRGKAVVLYGHVPTPNVEWVNNTACLDTGCVFGGKLTAMRYPEREIVDVPAKRAYSDPVKPLFPAAPKREPGIMSLSDVQGKLLIETAERGRISIKEEQAAGALEAMSRFATDPRWLMYLPPTMSPCSTSSLEGFLEHPSDAFSYFQENGVNEVICEEKHMGSRGVILVSRNPDRFNAPKNWQGTIHTRTGRPFFKPETEKNLLTQIDAALWKTRLWEELEADWIILDTEILPWGLKAGDMIRNQYASIAAAGLTDTFAANTILNQAHNIGLDVSDLQERFSSLNEDLSKFRDSYRRYVGQEGEIRIAPFQLLAAGSNTFERRDHSWHLSIADRLVEANSELFKTTKRLRVNVANAESVASAIQWWTNLTGNGGEGMVVKPWENLLRTSKGMIQPGIKVRGQEYLRIIYGPDYLEPDNLKRLRNRSLGHKRSLAVREYALGLEALRRAAANEPLYRIHEAVFGVLALESDPVDPRL